ncbi:MAG TPA: hypothetical protein VFN40_14185, partial [Gemmatimonadales bacterium]|nr:hypothetical protein [Gemmatimonadales bacterium]
LWSSVATAVVAFGVTWAAAGRRYFEFVALPGAVAGLVVLVLATYFVAAELVKRPFFRRLDL